jgi:hypothetical protein
VTDPAREARNCVLGRLAQMSLQFAEGELDIPYMLPLII